LSTLEQRERMAQNISALGWDARVVAILALMDRAERAEGIIAKAVDDVHDLLADLTEGKQ